MRPQTTDDRPSGAITLLFTDIEGSTRLLQRLGERYPDVLGRHHRIVRAAIAAHGGHEVSTEGDSFFVVSRTAFDAVAAASDIQRQLAAEAWPEGTRVAVRMGIHTGRVELRDDTYLGLEVHRAARVANAAHGGQVLLSEATREQLADQLPPGVTLRDMGIHRLKDIDEPEHLHQLVIDGLRADFPPLRALSARFHILPAEVSTFVGRRAELERILELLGGTRLLTLTGPGGTGKTRLALHAARSCEGRYRDGVANVALAPITDARLVAPTIRAALGFAEDPARDPVDLLIEQLAGRELLLLLDNFEQVLPAAANVGRLLAGAERLTVLVTSRAALHLAGEQELPVPPLGLPVAEGASDPDAVSRSEAVALFVERARQVLPTFVLDARNVQAVAGICARLDGLPLAIELAAARLKILSPEALLARLGRRLEILRSSDADRDDRQRTLRATIDWSHDLLDPPVRTAFRRLAAFTDGASLEAAEALVPALGPAPDGAPREAVPAVLDALGTLVDHSLVRQEERDGVPRFHMLETVREYGLERLGEAGEAETMAEAHARWFLDRVAGLAPGFTTGPEALDRVTADHDNVRAALRWALAGGESELALRSVGALWRFWHLRGHLQEGLALCEAALAMPGARTSSEARARALYARGSIRYWQGDADRALDDYRASLDDARVGRDRAAEAEALYGLAYVHLIRHEWSEARSTLAGAETAYLDVGDGKGALNARVAKAYVSALEGDFQTAAAAYEAAMPELEASGDRFWLMSQRVPVAWTMQRLGRFDRASELHKANLRGAIELGDRSLQHLAVHGLASIAAQLGDTERALRLAGGAEMLVEELGARAPGELVIALDPVQLARDRGARPVDVERLLAEGRRLPPHLVFELALETATVEAPGSGSEDGPAQSAARVG